MKTISNLIQNIGKCRDMLATKDFDTIFKHLYLFEKVHIDTRTQLNRFIKNPNYILDFTFSDLAELSNEIFQFVKNYQNKMTFESGLKELTKHEIIDNWVISSFTTKQANMMYLDRKLREAYKLLSYTGLMLWLLKKSEEQNSFDNQIINTIRSFL